MTIVLLATVFMLGYLVPQDNTVGDPLIQSTYISLYEELNACLIQGVFDSAPTELINVLEEEAHALKAASGANSPQEFYKCALDYYDALIREYEAGYLQAYFPAIEIQANLISRLSNDENANWYYPSTSKFPALYYCAWIIGAVPYVSMLIPPTVAAALMVSQRRDGLLLARPPSNNAASSICAISSSTLASTVIMLAAFLPPIVLSIALNGIGDPAYPVDYYQGGKLRQSTLCQVLFEYLVAYILYSLLVSAIAEFGRAATSKSWIGVSLAVLIPLGILIQQYAPSLLASHEQLLQMYIDSQSLDQPLSPEYMSLIPTSYFDLPSLSGSASSGDSFDVLAIEGASFGRGCLTLSVFSALFTCLSFKTEDFRTHKRLSVAKEIDDALGLRARA